MSESILEFIRPGDRVTIAVPGGIGRQGVEYTRRTGRAVMRGPAGWVLNLGGPHGTPGIASEENIIKAPMARKRRGYNPWSHAGRTRGWKSREFSQKVQQSWAQKFENELIKRRPDLEGQIDWSRIEHLRWKHSPEFAVSEYLRYAQNPYLGHGAFRQEVSKSTWNRYFKENMQRLYPEVAKRIRDGHFDRNRIAYMRDEMNLSPASAVHAYAQIGNNPHGGSMHWGRHLGQMETYKPVSQKTHRQYIAWLLKNAAPGEEVPTFDKHEGRKYSIRADMLESFRKSGRNPGRRKRRRNRGRSCPARIPKRRWIQRGKCKGKIHKGKLHRKLQRWYGLSPNKKIPRSMLAKAYRRAQKRGDTKTMRQINLAKVFKKIGRKRRRKSRRR